MERRQSQNRRPPWSGKTPGVSMCFCSLAPSVSLRATATRPVTDSLQRAPPATWLCAGGASGALSLAEFKSTGRRRRWTEMDTRVSHPTLPPCASAAQPGPASHFPGISAAAVMADTVLTAVLGTFKISSRLRKIYQNAKSGAGALGEGPRPQWWELFCLRAAARRPPEQRQAYCVWSPACCSTSSR